MTSDKVNGKQGDKVSTSTDRQTDAVQSEERERVAFAVFVGLWLYDGDDEYDATDLWDNYSHDGTYFGEGLDVMREAAYETADRILRTSPTNAPVPGAAVPETQTESEVEVYESHQPWKVPDLRKPVAGERERIAGHLEAMREHVPGVFHRLLETAAASLRGPDDVLERLEAIRKRWEREAERRHWQASKSEYEERYRLESEADTIDEFVRDLTELRSREEA